MTTQQVVGPVATTTSIGPNTAVNTRAGNMGDTIVSELQGRFYEATYRGTSFSWGKALTSLSANSITLVAATTPIIGVWNPTNSGVNLVITQAALSCYLNTLTTPVGAGSFMWAVSTGNSAISTGNAPWKRNTLTQSGSLAKGFDLATALTGLTNNLVIVEPADFRSPTGQTYGTIVAPTAGTSLTDFGGVQNFDGSLIVPPGGVLALLNTTSTATMSATARIMWNEVPV